MKNILRIALPRLEDLNAAVLLEHAWFDRKGEPARQGALTAAALAGAWPGVGVYAVLHPDDAIVARVNVPAVAPARFPAAVRGALEALVLSDLDALAIGHGKREPDGTVTVAWADRAALHRACRLLSDAGLKLRAVVPAQALQQDADAPPQERDAARWHAPLPGWTLELPRLAPTHVSPWRPALRWSAIAALLWIAGLNLYAGQLRGEAEALRARMQADVRDAFPDIPVVLDPMRQAQQGYEALLAQRGGTSGGDFFLLARAAAQVLPFAADAVETLHYRDQTLTLQLAGAEDEDARLADAPAIAQRAAALGVRVERDEQADGQWRIVPVQP
ncbi:type II secretion system protein GspL [Bordetella sp. 2513F-2]